MLLSFPKPPGKVTKNFWGQLYGTHIGGILAPPCAIEYCFLSNRTVNNLAYIVLFYAIQGRTTSSTSILSSLKPYLLVKVFIAVGAIWSSFAAVNRTFFFSFSSRCPVDVGSVEDAVLLEWTGFCCIFNVFCESFFFFHGFFDVAATFADIACTFLSK